MEQEDLNPRHLQEQIDQYLDDPVYHRPSKMIKKTEQKIISIFKGPGLGKKSFAILPEQMRDEAEPRLKIGFEIEKLYHLPQYRTIYAKMPRIGNNFQNLKSLTEQKEEQAKQLNKMATKVGYFSRKKLEPYQPMLLRISLVECMPKLKYSADESFKTLAEVTQDIDYTPEKQAKLSIRNSSTSEDKIKAESRMLYKGWKKAVAGTARVARYFQKLETHGNCKKLALSCLKAHKKKVSRNVKNVKENQQRAKKLFKESQSFWRKRGKELSELKKKKVKLENEMKKREEEKRETELQKKRLEFLMKQSEIYADFMAKKLGMRSATASQQPQANPEADDDGKAFENVSEMINDQRRKLELYSSKETEPRRRRGVAKAPDDDQLIEIKKKQEDQNESNRISAQELRRYSQPVDFSSVQLEEGSNLVHTPKCFQGTLKEYQLKGLRWLDNLYEQGINGILADEMGLGKTIQAIVLLAHISETKGNWGPFMVVAPNSTLYNWKNELNKFAPLLNIIPYWGSANHRKVIRKYFDPKQLGEKNSPMHVVITSYNLAVTDYKSFYRVRWQYIILDEAQAIKNVKSERWKTLLSFRSRNKLLLTGTPIQNSMAELWALLHFIMPKLFDSHEQFQEWFSKDIEANSGNKQALNQIQLNRLHSILKPFMLRRVKKDVEKEIGDKTEYSILCRMSRRQSELYTSIKKRLSLNEFFQMIENKTKVKNLMNLVMQFRKVCNHPQLFERRQNEHSYVFNSKKPDVKSCQPSYGVLKTFWPNWTSPIVLELPKLVLRLGEEMRGSRRSLLDSEFFLHRNLRVEEDLFGDKGRSGFFSFVRLSGIENYERYWTEDLFLAELCRAHFYFSFGRKKYIEKIRNLFLQNENINKEKNINSLYKQKNTNLEGVLLISNVFHYYGFKDEKVAGSNLLAPKSVAALRQRVAFSISSVKLRLLKVVAKTPELRCSSGAFRRQWEQMQYNPLYNYLFYGSNKRYPRRRWLPVSSILNCESERVYRKNPNIHYKGILKNLAEELPTTILTPSFETMISDSAKLIYLDKLLEKLQNEGHRVLIFCQMTKMINILEEYLTRRRYKFFRLDGNTNISDRNQMVREFQTNPEIFAFILSTRAGGLGVTLTAADTVIFYDNDWNPTMDAQATDRVHRIGQTKPVSVYR